MAYLSGRSNATQRLYEALGLNPRKVRRFVLDVACDDAVRLYVEEYPDEVQIGGLADAIAGLSDDCRPDAVVVKPGTLDVGLPDGGLKVGTRQERG